MTGSKSFVNLPLKILRDKHLAWLNREKAPIASGPRVDTPDGLWERCENCAEVVMRKDLEANLLVCPTCDFHYQVSSEVRIAQLTDAGTFEELDRDLVTTDPLKFIDSKRYEDRIAIGFKTTGRRDAIVCGGAKIDGVPVQLGVFEFRFLGGSMGAVVGEKIVRLFGRSVARRQPAVIVSSSGGARMQEGIVSLMQMARTCAALAQLRDDGIPFISVLSHPTTGGVAASFATLGDINIAEPGALIGFAGPRVIQQTIREKLPEGFQRSEYLMEHGMLDRICSRKDLPTTIGHILKILCTRLNSRKRDW